MTFKKTKIEGVFILTPKRFKDKRGFFVPAFSAHEFKGRGLDAPSVAGNISYSLKRGTIRGMHYQAEPHGQAKLVRCTRGSIYDVAVDIRPGSPTYGQWVGAKLTAENRHMLYIPGDCAHGFQTLEDDTEVFYMVSSAYQPASERGFRWDDPAFRIKWPDVGERVIVKRDRTYPDYTL